MNEHFSALDAIFKALGQHASELALVALSVMGYTVRVLTAPPRASLGAYLRGVLLAVCTVWVVNKLALGAGLSESYRLATLGVAAFLADDILFGLVTLGTRLRNDPKGLVVDIKQLLGRS